MPGKGSRHSDKSFNGLTHVRFLKAHQINVVLVMEDIMKLKYILVMQLLQHFDLTQSSNVHTLLYLVHFHLSNHHCAPSHRISISHKVSLMRTNRVAIALLHDLVFSHAFANNFTGFNLNITGAEFAPVACEHLTMKYRGKPLDKTHNISEITLASSAQNVIFVSIVFVTPHKASRIPQGNPMAFYRINGITIKISRAVRPEVTRDISGLISGNR